MVWSRYHLICSSRGSRYSRRRVPIARIRPRAGSPSPSLTCMSLWCAYGMTATQLAERLATKSVAQTELSEKQGTLDRLIAQQQRTQAPMRTTPEAVASLQKAVNDIAEQVRVETNNGGCKSKCGDRQKDQREANALLVKMQSDLAATVAYDKLASDITAAQNALDKLDKTKAVKPSDPQTESMAKVLNVSTDSLALVITPCSPSPSRSALA